MDLTHFIQDIFGNIIAETNGTATGTRREYIWIPETEIEPTFGSRAVVDRPLAIVDAVNTATPVTWYMNVDHLNRPVRMTDAAKAVVWSAVWTPWGAPHAITGSATLNARFPGQWYQLEAGLHYNWHRSYDPSIGRYTQPDPLGFVDGPSVYGYAGGSPGMLVDPDGRVIALVVRCGLNQTCRTIVLNYCRQKLREFAKDESGAGKDLKQVTDALRQAARDMQERPPNDLMRKEFGKYVEAEKAGGKDFSWKELIDLAKQFLGG